MYMCYSVRMYIHGTLYNYMYICENNSCVFCNGNKANYSMLLGQQPVAKGNGDRGIIMQWSSGQRNHHVAKLLTQMDITMHPGPWLVERRAGSGPLTEVVCGLWMEAGSFSAPAACPPPFSGSSSPSRWPRAPPCGGPCSGRKTCPWLWSWSQEVALVL